MLVANKSCLFIKRRC